MLNTYTLPILPIGRLTFESAMAYWHALPERTARILADDSVKEALVDWPEHEGFGWSDRNSAVFQYLLASPGWAQRHFGGLADLESRLLEVPDFDWAAAERMMAPR